jgi:hypothetical protein
MSILNAESQDQTRSHLNFGTLTLRAPAPTQGAASPDAPMTVIVSGVGRSGTSMTAGILDALGIPMGKTNNLAVFEDEEFVSSLLYFDYARMHSLTDSRNAKNPRWGFKFPSLQNHLLPPQLSYFRNPHLIVVMRDPVAVATRAHMSDPDQQNAKQAFYNVSKQAFDMMSFVEKVECPTLLLSYEKCVAFPDRAIDEIAHFCGLVISDSVRLKALMVVSPNNSDYIKLFHKDHRGYFDGVQGNYALGWCCSNNSDEPVNVELLADGEIVASSLAGIYRRDLHTAGIGSGCHSFEIDVSSLGLAEDAVLRVHTVGGGFVLDGSGMSLHNLRKGPKERKKELQPHEINQSSKGTDT